MRKEGSTEFVKQLKVNACSIMENIDYSLYYFIPEKANLLFVHRTFNSLYLLVTNSYMLQQIGGSTKKLIFKI